MFFHAEGVMKKVPMTVAGAAQLKAELQRLKTVDRPRIIQAIADARSNGDLTENADYEAARERQGFIEGRIIEIESKLAVAHVIDPTTLHAEGRVVFGATVDVEDIESGDRRTYIIVGDDEADIRTGKISVHSPVSRALIGKSEGDHAEVHAPAGIRVYEVISVRYE
jgi:transcription elongation factor GreA